MALFMESKIDPFHSARYVDSCIFNSKFILFDYFEFETKTKFLEEIIERDPPLL